MPTFRFKNPLVGGVLAAIGASVCCVGPLALLALLSVPWLAPLFL